MTLSRLKTLLDKSPLTAEDKHNIAVIFGILSTDRQWEILNNWQPYLAQFILERERLNKQHEDDILAKLWQANDILDDAISKKEEQNQHKEQTKYRIRKNLDELAITE